MSECPLVPVHSTSGCVGHLRRTARGFAAYDSSDKLVGVFASADEGAAALLAKEVVTD